MAAESTFNGIALLQLINSSCESLLLQSILQTGTDTSSSTIEWGMAELLNHPEVMAKARAELDEVVGTGRLLCKTMCAYVRSGGCEPFFQ